MISLYRYLPCLRYDVNRLRSKNIDQDLHNAEGDLDTKRKQLHAVAKDFEATVHEFLEDNKRIRIPRNG